MPNPSEIVREQERPNVAITLNLIQKLYVLMVSDEINIWHYPMMNDRPFRYWIVGEPGNKAGYGFDTLEEMIEAAYKHIDPLQKPLKEPKEPEQEHRPVPIVKGKVSKGGLNPVNIDAVRPPPPKGSRGTGQ